jgi:hypothetical protein
MYNMAELFELHESIDLDSLRLACPIHVIAGKVNKHDMLSPVLF